MKGDWLTRLVALSTCLSVCIYLSVSVYIYPSPAPLTSHPPTHTEVVKVFDGNSSLQRRMFRLVTVSRAATVAEFLTAALRAFHLPQEVSSTFLTDAYSAEETELTDPLPVSKLTRREGKRPAVFLRYRYARPLLTYLWTHLTFSFLPAHTSVFFSCMVECVPSPYLCPATPGPAVMIIFLLYL